MPQIGTLNEMDHLKQSKFGRCWPRHGLNLLYWFAHDCLEIYDNRMSLRCVPSNQDYGFHEFHNREDTDGFLLPQTDLTYYEVGNLNSPGADELPDYVQMDYTSDVHGSNKDRIIVCVEDESWLHRVYVTVHNSSFTFSHNSTYRISKGLLKIIQSQERRVFLQQAGYQGQRNTNDLFYHEEIRPVNLLTPQDIVIPMEDPPAPTWPSLRSCCTIL